VVDNFNCVGAGQTLNQSPLYKIPFGQIFFRGVSSPSIGALQAMLNTFVSYARQRTGAGGKSTDDPVAQQICAEVVAAIDEMKLVLRWTNSAVSGKRRSIIRSKPSMRTYEGGWSPSLKK
jgi:3-hydroxy-9,10-secoandrosta-1,3,5(10)-triene-9,17-dione monooxygenase